MYVVEVIPLARGAHVDTLTYYASVAYPIGSLITIPLRKKEVQGLVVETKPVANAKAAVRAATFTLRKLSSDTPVHALPPLLVATAEALAKRLPATLGSILYALLPRLIREGIVELPPHEESSIAEGEYVTSVLTAAHDERYRVYTSTIREVFAHGGSVLFVVPTAADITPAVAALAHGIEDRVVAISPRDTLTEQKRAYKKLHDLRTTKLIVTSSTYAHLDRHDITTIILDQSAHPQYRSRTRPFLDTRDTLTESAKIAGRALILGDILPRTEDEHARRTEHYATEGEHPRRIAFQNTFTVLSQTGEPDPQNPFPLISPELHEALTYTHAKKQRSFLLAARRGLAPMVGCLDCGYIFRCPDSGAPYSLMREYADGEERRFFYCSTSGRKERAQDTCPECGSWRLRERGIGIQHIADELARVVPGIPVTLFDHTTADTFKRAQQRIETFTQRGGILLGTPMALPHITEPVACAAITSLEATRAVPTWRADETLLHTLLTLRDITTDHVLVQTRAEPGDILKLAEQGRIDAFYDEEIALRRQLRYPPFATFIHLAVQGTPRVTDELEAEISETLAPVQITFYNGPYTASERRIRYGLIRIPVSKWPDPALRDALASLPPSVRIEVNPYRIV